MLLTLWSLLKFTCSLESSLCQNVRILDKRFPASIAVPFKSKCSPLSLEMNIQPFSQTDRIQATIECRFTLKRVREIIKNVQSMTLNVYV